MENNYRKIYDVHNGVLLIQKVSGSTDSYGGGCFGWNTVRKNKMTNHDYRVGWALLDRRY